MGGHATWASYIGSFPRELIAAIKAANESDQEFSEKRRNRTSFDHLGVSSSLANGNVLIMIYPFQWFLGV
jgi:hypothetical protein